MLAFERGNPYKYVDPDGHVTVQIGTSGTSSFGLGGTIGGGVVFGFSGENGLQFGFYKVAGGGVHYGGTGSLTIDLTISLNDDINDLEGETVTAGGSGDVGLSAGGENNLLPALKDGELNPKARFTSH